jgi:AraC-like DNA-binding protein
MTMIDGTHPQDGSTAAQAFWRMLMGFRTTQLIHVAAKLNIADLLANGPLSADALAQTAGVHPRSLYRLLRALASLGIFAERDDGRFQLTPLAEPLRSTIAGSLHATAILYGEPWC